MPPLVTAGSHIALNFIADSLYNYNTLYRWRLCQCFISYCFRGNSFVAAEGAIANNQHFSFTVDNSITQSVRAESAENDAMNSADAGTSQGSNAQFGNHRHIKNNPVALLHALSLQNI